jgi:hypothetical protein
MRNVVPNVDSSAMGSRPRTFFGISNWLWLLSSFVLLAGCGPRVIRSPGPFPKAVGLEKYLIGESRIDQDILTASLVYSLSPETITGLSKYGVAYFKEDLKSRDGTTSYEKWLQTPIVENFRYHTDIHNGRDVIALNSSGCVDYGYYSDQLLRDLCEAIKNPGSYYAVNGSGYLIVVSPKAKVAAYYAYVH